jgi:hypothetical protein
VCVHLKFKKTSLRLKAISSDRSFMPCHAQINFHPIA